MTKEYILHSLDSKETQMFTCHCFKRPVCKNKSGVQGKQYFLCVLKMLIIIHWIDILKIKIKIEKIFKTCKSQAIDACDLDLIDSHIHQIAD